MDPAKDVIANLALLVTQLHAARAFARHAHAHESIHEDKDTALLCGSAYGAYSYAIAVTQSLIESIETSTQSERRN